MTRVIELARVAARRIRGGTDPVEAIAQAINGAVAENIVPEAGYADAPSGEGVDLRSVQWAVYLGANTARRLAEEWSIPLRRARELLVEAQRRGLLGRDRNSFTSPQPGDPNTRTVQAPRVVVAARRSA